MPNYLGLQIPVMQFWNLDIFENLLLDYSDKEIIQFLKFGWPINHDGRQYSNGVCENWKGAKLHANQVNKYLTRSPGALCRAVGLCFFLNFRDIVYNIFENVQLLWLLHSIGPSP